MRGPRAVSTLRGMASEGSVICAACGTENGPGHKFCMECGAALARACPTCGTPNPPQSKFCVECGASLETEAAAPPAAPVSDVAGTERRLVSVLFLDLV